MQEGQENRLKQLSCQSDEIIREVPSVQTHHDSYKEEELDLCFEPYAQLSDL